MDVVELHERALDQAARLVGAVDPAQLDGPTPCAEWDVRALLAHLVSGNRRSQAVAEGEWPQRGGTAAEVLGDNPAAAYRETARALAEAWRRPGRLDRSYRLPFGDLPGEAAVGMHLMETVLHGWDLARATGQDPGFDPEVVEAADRFARSSMPERRRPGSPFADAVEAPPVASAIDRLAAYAGRLAAYAGRRA
jgi:uncharacterized protein (TIGR03086 family)